MTREVDLVSYLPPFLAEFKEISATLEAENPEFVLVWNAAERVLSNEFIETADEYGISRFENMIGLLPSNGDTIEIRKARVMSKWLNTLPYTMRTLIKKLQILCGGDDFIVKKNFNDYKINIITHLREYSQIQELQKLLDEIIPANITIVSLNITAVKADGNANIYSGFKLTGKHKKISTEVKNYGLE